MNSRAVASSVPVPDTSLTHFHHGAAVILAAAIMLGVSVMTLGMRLYQRWPWNRLFKIEDVVLVTATLLSAANVTAAAVAVHAGFGQHEGDLTSEQVSQTKMALVGTFATAFATEGVAIASFLLLLRSMKMDKRFHQILWALIGCAAVWSLAGVIRFAASSSPGAASPLRGSWIAFGVIGILLQLATFASALSMILPLRMKPLKKLEASFWFVLCIPCIIAATIVRLLYTPSSTFGPDFTWHDTTMVIVLLIETNLMVASAACPSFRHLLASVSTGFLVAETARSASKGGSGALSHSGGSYFLNSLGKRVRHSHQPRRSMAHRDMLPLGDKSEQYSATVRGDVVRSARSSIGSEAIMVRRSVDVEAITASAEPTPTE